MTTTPLADTLDGFRGELIAPDDPRYDDARTVYNAMIDRRPQLIARCADVADVIAAIRYAREERLEVAVRGGGHSGPGLGLVEDGLVIDCSAMRGIRVDPDTRTVRAEAGCRWGEVDHATHPFGLAAVSGVISTTGVAGLTLGGGHGYLTRRWGLTVDNLRSADVVLADGSLVHASEDEHPDLFWALRGGGGNFGVVTSFEHAVHPVETVIAGPTFWPLDRLEDTLRWYREWLPGLPEELYAFYLVGEVPAAPLFPEEIHGEKVCGLVWCCTGPRTQADDQLAAAHAVAEPLFEHVAPMPWPVLQSLFDGLYPPGLQWYWKGDFVREIPDEAVAGHARFAEVPTMHSMMHLYPVDGAVHRKAADETAWGYRDVTWSMVVAGVDPDPENADRLRDWVRGYWEALHPYSAGAAYVNFMMEEGDERIQATYGGNFERLQRVKATYDPDNFFHVNQNIPPAG